MTSSFLDRKLDALASYARLERGHLRRLAEVLPDLDDWQASRINPLAFAAEHGLPEDACVELFVHAAKVGLFDFSWNLMCGSCGAYVLRRGTIDALEPLVHCALCDVDVDGSLDDQVEVAFALNPAAGRAVIDPYADADTYLRTVFSPNFRRGPRVDAAMRAATLGIELAGPEKTVRFELDAEPRCGYGVVSVERNVAAWLEPSSNGASAVTLDLLETGLFPSSVAIAAGPVAISVRNRCKTSAGFALVRDDDRIGALIAEEPSRIAPFLTGKQLLNTQAFRDLFRVQTLVPDLHLPLRSLTLLFTDLKGSTALYDRTGDAYAFALVRAHYAELAEAVRANAGAVIKTMGDAVMASFSHPVDGVRAAVEMVERIEALNAAHDDGGNALGLKIGLHEGPALAVNADDRLDYFGQTVNIAARVQALAEAGEIWHTDAMLASSGVEAALREGGYDAKTHSVSLKGVGEPVRVLQWSAAPPR